MARYKNLVAYNLVKELTIEDMVAYSNYLICVNQIEKNIHVTNKINFI